MTPTDLRRQDFYYELPTELIAQHPAEQRTASRLLYLHGKNKPQDLQFTDFPRLLQPNDLLVFNNTRVIKARLLGHKATGGRVECLVERLLDDHRALVHLRASNPPRPGQSLIFADGDEQATVHAKNEMGLVELAFTHPILPLLDQYGALPLPPYITHTPTADDEQRYQTVFAEQAGAVAAPTAGLHFDQAMLKMLEQQSIAQAFVTLHVGAGTFQPVRTERIADHQMHAEYFTVPAATLQAIEQTKARGGRVIAIGTTSVRALESARSEEATSELQSRGHLLFFNFSPFTTLFRSHRPCFCYPACRCRDFSAGTHRTHCRSSNACRVLHRPCCHLAGHRANQGSRGACDCHRHDQCACT